MLGHTCLCFNFGRVFVGWGYQRIAQQQPLRQWQDTGLRSHVPRIAPQVCPGVGWMHFDWRPHLRNPVCLARKQCLTATSTERLTQTLAWLHFLKISIGGQPDEGCWQSRETILQISVLHIFILAPRSQVCLSVTKAFVFWQVTHSMLATDKNPHLQITAYCTSASVPWTKMFQGEQLNGMKHEWEQDSSNSKAISLVMG
jgi:hypothetical protein